MLGTDDYLHLLKEIAGMETKVTPAIVNVSYNSFWETLHDAKDSWTCASDDVRFCRRIL